MKQLTSLILISIFTIVINCKKTKTNYDFSKLNINEDLYNNDTIKNLSKFSERKNYPSEKLESKSKTSSVLQTFTFTNKNIGNTKRYLHFNNYKTKASIIDDTLNVFINNNNGYFGNGILIKIFNNKYFIKNIDPKTVKNELKFIDYVMLKENLTLNKNNYKLNDSIFGYINYECQIDPTLTKTLQGYFKTKIK